MDAENGSEITQSSALVSFRYNEGVTDVRGNSIKLVQEPVVVFSEAQISSVVTKYIILFIHITYCIQLNNILMF